MEIFCQKHCPVIDRCRMDDPYDVRGTDLSAILSRHARGLDMGTDFGVHRECRHWTCRLGAAAATLAARNRPPQLVTVDGGRVLPAVAFGTRDKPTVGGKGYGWAQRFVVVGGVERGLVITEKTNGALCLSSRRVNLDQLDEDAREALAEDGFCF